MSGNSWVHGRERGNALRVTRIGVERWRNLRSVEMEVPPESGVVCLIGENGSGKSTILELLSAAAHHLGISPGIEMPRGDPFAEPHEVLVEATASEDLVEQFKTDHGDLAGAQEWAGGLVFSSRLTEGGSLETSVRATKVEASVAAEVSRRFVRILRSRSATQHLYLDADRSYPPIQIQPHQFSEIWTQDWASDDWNKQWAYRPTRTLYEEWNKYFIGTEERVAAEFITEIRRAQNSGEEPPKFVDPFESYKNAVMQIFPHLVFVGVQSKGVQRTVLFDSSGMEIPFSRLSGGEREIAFLIGQIERFRLRTGLLMIDEPELHLNPDLLRTWVAFLRDTVEDGQVWMATHSLEAVEVAGPESSFVFERDAEDRLTRSVTPLIGRPIVSALAAAVGAPAFSIGKLRFVFVEGDRQSRERERFFDLCGDESVNRFIEGGSCHEVLRRLSDVRDLAVETDEQLRVGGIVDRDFRPADEIGSISRDYGVHVLGCHEVENLFLHPPSLESLRSRAVIPETVSEMLRDESDSVAGLWIAQRADSMLPNLSSTPKETMSLMGPLQWLTIAGHVSSYAEQGASHFKREDEREAWAAAVNSAFLEYEAIRDADDLWAKCLGKQVQRKMSRRLGFSTASTMQRYVLSLWRDGTIEEPAELIDIRRYVSGLAGSRSDKP